MIGQLLAQRGLRFEFILDEGLMVLDGVVPSHTAPVAMIGVVEKVRDWPPCRHSCDECMGDDPRERCVVLI